MGKPRQPGVCQDRDSLAGLGSKENRSFVGEQEMGWRKDGPNRSGGVVLKLNVGEVITVLPHGE